MWWWWWGADGKVSIERLYLSLSLLMLKNLLTQKVIKSFVPELRSRKCFCVSGFLCYLHMSYGHSMYISHIHVWLCITVTWFQVFLSNTNNLHTVVWFQIFQPNKKFSSGSSWPIDGTLTGTTTLGHSWPGNNNSNKRVLHPPRSWASPSDAV